MRSYPTRSNAERTRSTPIRPRRRNTSSSRSSPPDLAIHPLTPERWRDLERLFGERGACGGCWCMWWRLPRSQFSRQKGAGNRRALKRIVEAGEEPGLLAYAEGQPVGWCAVAPRARFPVLERSRILRRVDDEPVWSIVCFFVARPYRKRRVTVKLLRAAMEYAAKNGARILEGYPVDPKRGSMPDAFAWTGLASAFRAAGFEEVLRRSDTRPIMRRTLRPPRAGPRSSRPRRQPPVSPPPASPRAP